MSNRFLSRKSVAEGNRRGYIANGVSFIKETRLGRYFVYNRNGRWFSGRTGDINTVTKHRNLIAALDATDALAEQETARVNGWALEDAQKAGQRAFDAAIKAATVKALRDAAAAAQAALATETGGHTSTYSVRKWLHQRADEIEQGA